MSYYTDVQYIAGVDRSDHITKKIERWKAHKQAILHRGITIAVFVNDTLLLQKRKHPVFDGVWDATISTHQLYTASTLSADQDTALRSLSRELNITQKDILNEPTAVGTIYYKAKDPKSIFWEHEMCHVLTCTIRKIPQWNTEFAYELQAVPKQDLMAYSSSYAFVLAPWVQEMIRSKLI